jgi:heterodisulfide reductase subunit B
MRYGYFPGCSLTHSAQPYDLSTREVAGALGLALEEIEDWNCCGATEYASVHKTSAYALVGRNLALASQQGLEQVVAPCSLCYLNLRKLDHLMADHARVRSLTDDVLAAGGLRYAPGSLRVRHLLDTVVEDIGLETIRQNVSRPLAGLRVAPYYGCLIVRPKLNGGAADPEYPTQMDRLLEALGAEVADFPLKTHCCGGHMTQISAATAYELIRRLLQGAVECRADVIVTACPMCQLNLDAYQGQVNRHFGTDFRIPVLFFTQMIGLAMGLSPGRLGLGREVVPAAAALAKIGQARPAEPEPPRRKRDDKSLPMPRARKEA